MVRQEQKNEDPEWTNDRPQDFDQRVTHFKRLLDCAKPEDFTRQFVELEDSLNGELTDLRIKHYAHWDDADVESLLNEVRKAALERGKANLIRTQ